MSTHKKYARAPAKDATTAIFSIRIVLPRNLSRKRQVKQRRQASLRVLTDFPVSGGRFGALSSRKEDSQDSHHTVAATERSTAPGKYWRCNTYGDESDKLQWKTWCRLQRGWIGVTASPFRNRARRRCDRSPYVHNRQPTFRRWRQRDMRAPACKYGAQMLITITYSALALAMAIAATDIWVRTRGEIDRIKIRYARHHTSRIR